MDTRERFVRTLTGEETDRVPFIKVFGGTNAIHKDWEKEYAGIGECIDQLIGFEGIWRGWGHTPVNMDASNLDETEIIKETEDILVERRGDGTICQMYKSGDYARHTIGWPVKTQEEWEVYKKKHLDPEDHGRFPPNWAELVKEYRARDYPLQLTHRGVYGFIREKMGDENLAYAFYDNPGLVHEIMIYYTDMAISIWKKQLKDVKFDLIECWEDMASKNGSLISPKTFRQFMTPCYKKIAGFAAENGIKIILVDSDGFIEDLTGLMLEAGVTALYPYEALAGNDVARTLDRYPRVGVIGGLRKECMYEGRDSIDLEIEKARELIKKGRFIPGPDHFVLKLCTFENYRYFMESLKQVVMTTKPSHG